METAKTLEQLVRRVIDEREFEIRIADWCGEVAVTVLDENDPREGCGQLRGESSTSYCDGIIAVLIDACQQALRDDYPQATACGRCIKRLDTDRWTHCVLDKVHDGSCRDEYGNIETPWRREGAMKFVTERTPEGWCAYDAETYDGAVDSKPPFSCMGHGKTQRLAVKDLMEQLVECESTGETK